MEHQNIRELLKAIPRAILQLARIGNNGTGYAEPCAGSRRSFYRRSLWKSCKGCHVSGRQRIRSMKIWSM